jgi:hypothetical protein
MSTQQITEEDDNNNSSQPNVMSESSAPISTMVSDDEDEDIPVPSKSVEKESVPPVSSSIEPMNVGVIEQLDTPIVKAPSAAPVKKVIKKKV